MNKRLIPTVALALVVLGVMVYWAVLSFSPEVSIELSEEQIQAQLNPRFPSEKCVLAALCLELREPRVRLNVGPDRVGFSTEFLATLGKRRMPGTATFTGKPRYVQDAGAFYLDDIQVTEFRMSGNAPDFDEVVKVRGPKVMATILQNVPIYTLSSDSKYGSLAKFALRSVRIADEKLHITFLNPLGWFNVGKTI